MSTPEPVPSPLAPVAPAERIELLDIFRGFALLGVLIANMRGFSGPLVAYFDHSLMWQDPISRATQSLIDLFVSGRFITIFAFLFGIGFAIQIERAATRPPGFLLRRFGFLMILGLIHIYLLWWGDILLTYSLFGFALLLFRNRQPRTLLYWAAGLYLFPLLIFGAITLAATLVADFPTQPPVTQDQLNALIQTYATGSYLDILPARFKETNHALGFVFVFGPRLLSIFLAGLWVWRRGILSNAGHHQDMLRRCQRWSLAIGLPLSLTAEAVMQILKPNPAVPTPAAFAYFALLSAAIPAMSLFYLCTVARLASAPGPSAALRRFAPVGRMALTNYLTQTIVCTLIFYGYGLGFFGKLAPLPGLLLALVLFALQMAASAFWLRNFAQGPMESLWRRVTYLR